MRIAELDSRILRLERELVILRTERNTYAPLCRLPDEILVRIAQCNASLHGRGGPREAFKMTWLCHHLRYLLVPVQQLWSHIDIAYPDEVVDEFLERTPSRPLHLWSSRKLQEGNRKILSRCIPRAASLTLKGPHLDFVYAVSLRILIPSLPSLRCLVLSQTYVLIKELIRVFEAAPLLEKVTLDRAFSKVKEPISDDDEDGSSNDDEDDSSNDDDEYDDIDDDDLRNHHAQLKLRYLTHLTLRDTEETVVALLDLFPTPTSFMGVSIYGKNAHWNDSTPWSSISGSNARIMERLLQFWTNHPQQQGAFPSGHVASRCRWEESSHVIKFSSPGVLEYQTKSNRITLADPWLGAVTSLVMRFDSCVIPVRRDKLKEYADWTHLSNVEHLRILGAKQMSGYLDVLSAVEEWITERHQEGHPLQTISFIGCTRQVKPMFKRLSGSPCNVTWVKAAESVGDGTSDKSEDTYNGTPSDSDTDG